MGGSAIAVSGAVCSLFVESLARDSAIVYSASVFSLFVEILSMKITSSGETNPMTILLFPMSIVKIFLAFMKFFRKVVSLHGFPHLAILEFDPKLNASSNCRN